MAIIQPSANASIIEGVGCDQPNCKDKAVADAQITMPPYAGKWGYFCMTHLELLCTRNPQLINNITTKPLELVWIRQ